MSVVIDYNPLRMRNAIQDIDHGIETVSAALVKLRVKQNTLVPMNRLPSELLSKIFHILRDDTATCVRFGPMTMGVTRVSTGIKLCSVYAR